MNLWVRSQNKEDLILIKNPICVYDNKIIYKESASYIITIAEYKTKERALEVLDEIQNFICNEIHENNINYEEADLILKGKIVDSLCKVYQMPKN